MGALSLRRVKMEQKIRVYNSDGNIIEIIKEATRQEADEIIKDTFARGSLVVDNKTLRVIHKIEPEIEEILVINTFGGGG